MKNRDMLQEIGVLAGIVVDMEVRCLELAALSDGVHKAFLRANLREASRHLARAARSIAEAKTFQNPKIGG